MDMALAGNDVHATGCTESRARTWRALRAVHVTRAATMLLVLLLLLGATAAYAATASGADAAARLRVVSAAQPELVTGGDVLLWSPHAELRFATAAGESEARAAAGDDGHYYLLSGLPLGRLEIDVRAADVAPGRLALRVSSQQGPLFAGPWQSPFLCQTDAFEIAPGLGRLPPAAPPTCAVPARDADVWLLPDGRIEVRAPEAPAPALRVRLLTRVIDRAIAQVAVPVPAAGADFAPGRRSAPWNGKLVYKFGGGCRGGWYRQGANTAGVLDAQLLAAGYAVASASLNVFGNNCNDLLAAEVMAMVKEAFIEQVGPPLFTLGFGCSGGSYQGLQIADNYPGLLDGIVVGCVFPEVGQAMLVTLFDARLLQHYFDGAAASGHAWTEAEQLAVSGFASLANLRVGAEGAGRIDATPRSDRISAEFDAVVSERLRWHPQLRPQGARATVFDHTVNVYGRDPVTGHARWPLDNRGVRYGLAAWRAGQIDGERFVHLNEHVGGLDRNGEFVAARTVHDIEATRAAYATGRILDGGQGLATTPVIDYRAWADRIAGGDTHLAFHSASLRERMRRANGDSSNLVALQEDGSCVGCPLFSLERPLLRDAVAAMDEWLTNLAAQPRSAGVGLAASVATEDRAARRARVLAARPTSLRDACVLPDPGSENLQGGGTRVVAVPTADGNACSSQFPRFAAPRLVAGAALANDVVACARRSLGEADFANNAGVALTPAQVQRLRAAFPDGVCDMDARPEGRVPHGGVWQSLGPLVLPPSRDSSR